MTERFAARLARAFGPVRDPEDDYAKELASWQIEQGVNSRDMTMAQSRRFIHANAALMADIDPSRTYFVGWLIERGRLGEGQS